jgi:hypothetical protein
LLKPEGWALVLQGSRRVFKRTRLFDIRKV